MLIILAVILAIVLAIVLAVTLHENLVQESCEDIPGCKTVCKAAASISSEHM